MSDYKMVTTVSNEVITPQSVTYKLHPIWLEEQFTTLFEKDTGVRLQVHIGFDTDYDDEMHGVYAYIEDDDLAALSEEDYDKIDGSKYNFNEWYLMCESFFRDLFSLHHMNHIPLYAIYNYKDSCYYVYFERDIEEIQGS